MILIVLLVVVGLALVLPGLLLRRFGYRNLTYSLAFSAEEVTEGDTVTLTETVCSSKLLPLPWLKAELTTSSSLVFAAGQSSVSKETRFVSSFFSLRPYKKIERKWKVTCKKRGVFTVSHAVLVLSDLFGVSEISQPFPEAEAVIRVLPAVQPFTLEQEFPLGFTGDFLRRRTLIPGRFAIVGIRQYADGDPLRDVCWSATARAGSPMVWQYQETANPSITVLLNLETRETDRDRVSDAETFEKAITICASCLADAANRRIPVRFLANTAVDGVAVETAQRTGPAEAMHLRRVLAELPDTITGRFSRLLRQVCLQDSAASIVVITALPDAETIRIAAQEPRVTVLSVRRLPASAYHLPNIRHYAPASSPLKGTRT